MGVVVRGSFKNTDRFFKRATDGSFYRRLERYAKEGVAALSAATPTDTGLTANSWDYEITRTSDRIVISWTNSNVVNGWANVAILIQYGHGTRNGGYVEGIDYINPAMRPIFKKLADAIWEEVKQ